MKFNTALKETDIRSPHMNPIGRILAAAMALLTLAAAFFFGLIVLVLVIGAAVVFWLGIRLRFWWIRRRAPLAGAAPANKQNEGEVIEAEYTVVSRRDD